MAFLAASIFLLFFITGPVNTLILETVPVNVRGSAMAVSILMIHLFGDLYSPEIVGRLADRMAGDLQKAMLLLPAVLLVAVCVWTVLAAKTLKTRTATKGARP